MAAINFEHSWGDGVAVLRYIKDIFKDHNENPFVYYSTKVVNIDLDRYVKKLGKIITPIDLLTFDLFSRLKCIIVKLQISIWMKSH